jgi:hypothetical protein
VQNHENQNKKYSHGIGLFKVAGPNNILLDAVGLKHAHAKYS